MQLLAKRAAADATCELGRVDMVAAHRRRVEAAFNGPRKAAYLKARMEASTADAAEAMR